MKFSIILLGAALCLFSSIETKIVTDSPFNTVTWEGGQTEKITWSDDGTAPNLGQMGITTVDLMAGGDTNQVVVANIGKVPATVKEITYNVPKNIGPPGNFYFIKYTSLAGDAFSGTFSIEGVTGTIKNFDPTIPNTPVTGLPATPTGVPNNTTNSTNSTNPYPYPSSYPAPASTVSSNPPSATPNVAASTPPSLSTPTAKSPLPTVISTNNAANLFPSFVGVATAAVAFAFTYLY